MNKVWIANGVEGSVEDILGVYSTKDKADDKKMIEEEIGDYAYIFVHEYDVE